MIRSNRASANDAADMLFYTQATGGSNTERMRIGSDGNVGIGTSSPAQKLHIGGSGFSYLRTTSTSYGGTGFDIGQHTGGSIYLNNRDNTPIIFQTNNAERMRILPSGGITFNGDTAAANALDDYEEGTWTPTDASGSGLVFAATGGTYQKIGNTVHVTCRFQFPTTTSGNNSRIGGLPFNARSTSVSSLDIAGGLITVLSQNFTKSLSAYVEQGETTFRLFRTDTQQTTNIINSNLSAHNIYMIGTYEV